MWCVAPVRERGLKSWHGSVPGSCAGRSRKGAWIEITIKEMRELQSQSLP